MARPTTEPTPEIEAGTHTRTVRTSGIGRTGETIPKRTWPFTRDELRKRYKDDPKELFLSIDMTLEELEQHKEELRRQTEEIHQINTQIEELETERDEYKEAFTKVSLGQHQSATRHTTPDAQSRKTTKLPDPDRLTDGKEPKFEDWLSRMKSKLAANADHYETEALRIAYVESRVSGDAATHLAPRMQEDAEDRFTTANEMFGHLTTIYRDPNKLQNAKYDFKRLVMKKNDKFHDFLTKFLHLAGEAKVPKSEYKFELNSKLSFDLRRAVITNFISESTFI